MTPRLRWFATCLFLIAGTATAQDDKSTKGEDRKQTGEGVILKVEPIKDSGSSKGDDKAPKKVRVTVNTSVVWRDWARDQADFSRKADPEKGAQSVATKGQPVEESETIVAEVDKDTTLHLRYRSSTDETNEGSRTIEKAEKKDGSPESNEAKTSPRDPKAPKIGLADLKAGLFVEVETKKGHASRLIVLKPVGEGTTPASEAKPAK